MSNDLKKMTNRLSHQIPYSHTEEKSIKLSNQIIKNENHSSFHLTIHKHSHRRFNFTPSDKLRIKKRGRKLEQAEKIYWGLVPSLFGNVIMTATSEGLCGTAFCGDNDTNIILNKLAKRWGGELVEDQQRIKDLAKIVFSKSQVVPLHLLGTDMQMQIWQNLLKIPYATVKSYSDLANTIGRPNAVRAVASAIGANPICWVIPCHRVLSKKNKLSGYRWGQDLKVALLSHESKLSPERLFDLQYSCLK